MAFVVQDNTDHRAVVLATANSTLTLAGNSSVSDIPTTDKTLTGGVITQMIFGSPSGNSAYWEIKRGANTVAVLDSTAQIDLRAATPLTIDSTGTLVANLNGSTAGFVLIEIKKTY